MGPGTEGPTLCMSWVQRFRPSVGPGSRGSDHQWVLGPEGQTLLLWDLGHRVLPSVGPGSRGSDHQWVLGPEGQTLLLWDLGHRVLPSVGPGSKGADPQWVLGHRVLPSVGPGSRGSDPQWVLAPEDQTLSGSWVQSFKTLMGLGSRGSDHQWVLAPEVQTLSGSWVQRFRPSVGPGSRRLDPQWVLGLEVQTLSGSNPHCVLAPKAEALLPLFLGLEFQNLGGPSVSSRRDAGRVNQASATGLESLRLQKWRLALSKRLSPGA